MTHVDNLYCFEIVRVLSLGLVLVYILYQFFKLYAF
jgi:hypothetical protein